MRPLTGTSKMQMKFELMRQTKPHTRFVAVHGRGLGSWISPTDPTLGQQAGDVWILNHPVVNLAAPATYKFKVVFKWIGAQGQTLGMATQASPTCYQPELRADLLVRSLSVTPITSGPAAGQWAYVALIANRGLTGAGPVEVVFANGSSVPVPATVAWVGAKSTARQRFVSAPCTSGTTLTVTVDPNQCDRRVRLREQRADDGLPGGADRLTSKPRVTDIEARADLRRAAKLERAMKTGVHPEYVDAHVRCTCGNEFMTRSTKPEIHVEICSACHPFYTGRQKLVDTGGRVERFQRRVAKGRRAARATTGS